jgi:hypothetical protein
MKTISLPHMKRVLYILALICAHSTLAAASPLGSHLQSDAGYLACVLQKIPESDRHKTALLLWPTPVPMANAGGCGPAVSRLNPSEINGLQSGLESATVSCEAELPADAGSREDASYGLLGVLLINPQTPNDTSAWDELMAGSRACTTAGGPAR